MEDDIVDEGYVDDIPRPIEDIEREYDFLVNTINDVVDELVNFLTSNQMRDGIINGSFQRTHNINDVDYYTPLEEKYFNMTNNLITRITNKANRLNSLMYMINMEHF